MNVDQVIAVLAKLNRNKPVRLDCESGFDGDKPEPSHPEVGTIEDRPGHVLIRPKLEPTPP